MLTGTEIKAAAAKLNWRTETSSPTQIGVNYHPFMWAWWSIYEKDDDASFLQIYSQNTGKTSRSFRRSWKLENRMKAAIQK